MALKPVNSTFAERNYHSHKGQGTLKAGLQSMKARVYRDYVFLRQSPQDEIIMNSLRKKSRLLARCEKMLAIFENNKNIKNFLPKLERFKYRLLESGFDREVAKRGIAELAKNIK